MMYTVLPSKDTNFVPTVLAELLAHKMYFVHFRSIFWPFSDYHAKSGFRNSSIYFEGAQ